MSSSSLSHLFPLYFVNRMNIRYQTKVSVASKPDKKAIDVAIGKFKAVKNALHLMLFHSAVIPLNQYESEDVTSSFSSFLRDLYSQDYSLHQQADQLIKEAMEYVINDEYCSQIVQQLLLINMEEVRKSGLYKMNQFARMNFILSEF